MSTLPPSAVAESVPWITIIWALVVIFFLILFKGPLGRFLERLSKLKVKAGKSGVEVSFDAAKAQAELSRAVEAKKEATADNQPVSVSNINDAIERLATNDLAPRFARSQVLWVDDRPENNVHERRAFEAIGLRFTLARSSEEALAILRNNSFAVIISDMGRPSDPRAGYTLLQTLRSQGDRTPFVIYAGSRAPEHKAETKRLGGEDCTNHPQELFEIVTNAIARTTLQPVSA